MSALLNAQNWIEAAWSETGRNFEANHVPVARFNQLEVDDLSFPFKNIAVESWYLNEGKLEVDSNAKIIRVPFIAFSVDEEKNSMDVQVNWAGRCGYGFKITFNDRGDMVDQKMRWVS